MNGKYVQQAFPASQSSSSSSSSRHSALTSETSVFSTFTNRPRFCLPILKMKLTATLTIALLPAVLALPTVDSIRNIFSRQSLNTITDTYLFSITLPQFTQNRNARNPSTLDWQSDGCTSSPGMYKSTAKPTWLF